MRNVVSSVRLADLTERERRRSQQDNRSDFKVSPASYFKSSQTIYNKSHKQLYLYVWLAPACAVFSNSLFYKRRS